MITNNDIKLINSLQRKKERQKNKLFIVEGVKLTNELLASAFEVVQLFSTSTEFEKHSKFCHISESQLSKISQLTTPNKTLCLVKIPDAPIPDQNKTSIVLEGINDPGNLGTIIRIADWYGIEQIICSNNSVDSYNPKVVAATMGSIFRVKVFYTDLTPYISNSPLSSYGALLNGKPMNSYTIDKKCNLIFGSESHGISAEIEQLIKHKIKITGSGRAESLNLSVSVGIICNEYYASLTS